MRPTLDDVTRYLDQLESEQLEERRILEELAGIEDGPQTDRAIQRQLRHHDPEAD